MQTVIHSVTTASEVIQLAIAPVFLLMGVSTLLGVLTGRLGRVVDRFRVLNDKYSSMQTQTLTQNASYVNDNQELYILSCRATWVHWAITLCTLSLLLVALVIGLLFLGSAINWDSSWLVSLLFIFAMTSLVAGLGCFLREIHLSKHVFQITKKMSRKLKSSK